MKQLVFALLFLAGCHSFYTVRGRVVSCADKKPIEGAIVHLHLAANTQKYGYSDTHADGTFRVAVNQPPGEGESHLIVAAAGHQTVRVVVVATEEEQTVCLPTGGAVEGEPHR